MTYYKNGELNDMAIKEALHKIAENFENGEISETRDQLMSIVNAIDEFEKGML